MAVPWRQPRGLADSHPPCARGPQHSAGSAAAQRSGRAGQKGPPVQPLRPQPGRGRRRAAALAQPPRCPSPYRSSAPSSLVTLSEDWITMTGLARSWDTSSCTGEESGSRQQGRRAARGRGAAAPVPPGWRSGSAPG